MSSLLSSYSEEKTKGLDGWLGPTGIQEDSGFLTNQHRYGEFDYFISYAKKADGPVLELASGACRVMAPLAMAGFDVIGIESSRSMIDMGRSKVLSRMPADARKRIKIIQGDMFNFAFNVKFPLIIIPFYTFWYNCRNIVSSLEPRNFNHDKCGEYAERCLKCILENLSPGGVFIIDGENYLDYSYCRGWWPVMAERYGFSYHSEVYSEDWKHKDWAQGGTLVGSHK